MKVVVNGPRLDRMKVSVKVAEDDVSQVVARVVTIVLDISGEGCGRGIDRDERGQESS